MLHDDSLVFKKMTQEQAEEIAYKWHYDGDYSFYDMESDEEDLAEIISPRERGEAYFSVTKNGELVGYFSITLTSNETIDVGLGMRPDLTGQGNGRAFLEQGLDYIRSNFQAEYVTLSVATFNQRAIKVYKKAGFKGELSFIQETNGGHYEFIKMTKKMNG